MGSVAPAPKPCVRVCNFASAHQARHEEQKRDGGDSYRLTACADVREFSAIHSSSDERLGTETFLQRYTRDLLRKRTNSKHEHCDGGARRADQPTRTELTTRNIPRNEENSYIPTLKREEQVDST